MYFPYLRGKQFELIALRELSTLFAANLDKISPIIEPVKYSSTLKSCLTELTDKGVNFNVIINPREGDLVSRYDKIAEILDSAIPNEYTNYQLGIIVDSRTEQNLEALIEFVNNINLNFNGVSLIHNSEIKRNNIAQLNGEFNVIYNIIYFSKTSRRYYREFDPATLVSLDDYFEEKSRNVDYLNQESDFSNEYRYYHQDNFVGFSDFLTIGDSYSETGFLPRAVAIHISYIDDERIKIKHFVSDSNEDVTDVAGKFSEALVKLIHWCNEVDLNTIAIREFQDLNTRGHFPGLGTLKKLSIMNHIELVIDNI